MIAALGLLFSLQACSSFGSVFGAAVGHAQVVYQQKPIADVLTAPHTDPHLRQRLRLAQLATRYAHHSLHLPDNRSYQQYADVGRSAVVYTVLATPELSLAPRSQCYWVVGCLAYQGFFDLNAAQKYAQTLQAQGFDTHIDHTPAYSTLGWLADPLLNTMNTYDEATWVSTIFHELAHQKLYIQDDTAFNESFARFVEEEGLKQFQARYALALEKGIDTASQQAFVRLMLALRADLQAVYAQPTSDAEKRQQKARLLNDAPLRLVEASQSQPQLMRYQGWFAKPLNNARLLGFGLYDQHVPAFRHLFAESNQDWRRFYQSAAAWGRLSRADREAKLEFYAKPRLD